MEPSGRNGWQPVANAPVRLYGQIKRKPLPWVATGCRAQRMARRGSGPSGARRRMLRGSISVDVGGVSVTRRSYERFARTDEAPRFHLALALHVDQPDRLDHEVVAQELPSRPRDLDLVRCSVRLHPAGHVHRVAPEVVEEAPTPDDAGHDRPGADADAEPQVVIGPSVRQLFAYSRITSATPASACA